MQDIIFVHGMFQNPKSWDKWRDYFARLGYNCIVPAWPLHEGEPTALRNNPPAGLGKLGLDSVLNAVEAVAKRSNQPIIIGHSVGGLIAQIMLNRGVASAVVAISSVAPNRMMELDWSFLKNAATITNPLKGDEMCKMDAETFHKAFANTLSPDTAKLAYEQFATHDSRNILRDCMGTLGQINLDETHGPLLMIGGEEDQIIPADLNEKNARAYKDTANAVAFRRFPNRSHFICGEPGWEEVAAFAANWISDALPFATTASKPLLRAV